MTWTQDDIETARSLWENTNTPAIEIGFTIGKTKNAVIGKARRLGWSIRDKADISRRHLTPDEYKRRKELTALSERLRSEKKIIKQEVLAKRKAEEALRKKEAIREEVEMIRLRSIPKMISLFDARENQCRNIIGDPKNMVVCGNACVEGKPYCSHHCLINYVPTNHNGATKRSFVETRR